MSLNEVFEIEQEETAPSTSPLRGKRRPDRAAAAGPWRLIGQKLVRQKVAMAAGTIVLLLYLVAAFCEFLAPGLPETSKAQYTYAPPQPIEWLVTDANGDSKISYADYAIAMVDELEQHAHSRRRFTAAYA